VPIRDAMCNGAIGISLVKAIRECGVSHTTVATMVGVVTYTTKEQQRESAILNGARRSGAIYPRNKEGVVCIAMRV